MKKLGGKFTGNIKIKYYRITKYIIASILLIIIIIILPIFFIDLKIKLPNTETILYDRNHIEIGSIINDKKTRHRYIKLDEIPDFTKKSIIAIEDDNFYNNIGIDFISILRALQNNIFSSKKIEGASTISSQVIRNMYWLNEKRTYTKKIKEFYLAVVLNYKYSKNKILETYLNIINFGHLNFGIESASNFYFGKKINNLTKAEQLAILVLPKNPNKYDVYKKNKQFKIRFLFLVNYLYKKGIIDEIEKEDILNEKLSFNTNHNNKLPYITDYIKKYNNKKYNIKTVNNNINNGTSNLDLTIDYNLTKKISIIARNTIIPLMWKNVGDYSIIIIDKKSNDIRVMIGGDDYYQDNGQVNSLFALRQVGSTLKPFTYTLAFKDLGYKPNTIITDLPIQFETLQGNTYSPKNYSLDYKGEVTLAQALSQSINIPAIKLTKQIGLNRLHSFLKELGITSLNKNSSYYGLALTLGVGEISLFELVRAYTIFTDDGKLCSLNILKNNNINNCKQIIEKKYTDMTNSILSNRYFKLGGFPINSNLDFEDKDVFVKTGTSRNFVDNYSIGYTKNYLIGVWVGNKDGSPMKGVSGSTGAGEIFRKIVYELENKKTVAKTIIQKKNEIEYLQIISPLNKSTYKTDKIKPQNSQKIGLKFKTNIIYDSYKWNINNIELKNDFWTIQKGNFEIKLLLFKNNKEILSKKSYIKIIE